MPDPEPKPNGDPFDVDHLAGDLRGRVVRGGTVMLGAQAARLALTLGAVAVLARLLDPRDFGLVAMVTAITLVLVRLVGLGLPASTVQRATVTADQVSTLFWINTAAGVLLTGLVAIAAPLVGRFYGHEELVAVTVAMSISCAFAGVAVQHEALLRRRMRFHSLALVALAADVAGFTAAITAAALGAGYWALVVMNLVIVAGRSLGMIVRSRWRPGRPRRGIGLRPMLTFGLDVSGAQILREIAANLDRLLVGKAVGDAALGHYTRAHLLLLIPLDRLQMSMRAVGVPALSRLQDDAERYRGLYRRAIELVAMIAAPATLFAIAAAEPIVGTVLGPKWDDAVPLLRALAPAALAASLACATSWAYLSLGHTRRLLRWEVLDSTITITAFFLGLPWGAMGVAVAYSIARVALWPVAAAFCVHGTCLRLTDPLRAVTRPVLAAMLAAAVLSVASPYLPRPAAAAGDLVIQAAVFTAVYALSWLVDPAGRRTVRDIVALVRELRPTERATIRQADS